MNLKQVLLRLINSIYLTSQNRIMKRIVTLFFCFITFVAGFYGQVQDTLKYLSLKPYDFHLQYLKNDSALLIDVRESFEFAGRRINGAVNIPSSGNLESSSDTLNKNFALFLYCTSGYRSKRVAGYLSGRGFRKLYSLEGGITAWKKDGFPVVKGKKKKGA